MIRLSIAALPVLILAACTAPPIANESVTVVNNGIDAIDIIESENAALPENADAGALTPAGLGELRIGMSRAELVAAAGDSSAASPDPESCEEFHPARAPAGVLVMLEQGRLTRVSLIRDATIKTDAGYGLGVPAAEVKAGYGDRAIASPHKYSDPPAEYITVWASGGGDAYVRNPDARGLVYEIGGDGKVSAIRAGGPAIQYVEGCA